MRQQGLIALAMLVASFTPSSAPASNSAPSGVAIASISTQGGGCPSDGVVADISSDGQALTILFSQLGVEVTADAAESADVTCRMDIRLDVPKHWSYALENVDFRGFVFLERGVVAHQSTQFHIQGEAPETGAAASFEGDEVETDYVLQSLGVDGPLRWSRCGKGKFVKLSTTLAVSNLQNPGGNGLIQVSSGDAQVYHLSWRRCD